MKKLVRLTEGDLHRIVKKSVQRIVSEASATPNGFKHLFGTNKRDRDFPLEQPNRMSEGQLHQIVKESVRQMLSELDWKTYANAAKKRQAQGNWQSADSLRNQMVNSFNNKYATSDNEYNNYNGISTNKSASFQMDNGSMGDQGALKFRSQIRQSNGEIPQSINRNYRTGLERDMYNQLPSQGQWHGQHGMTDADKNTKQQPTWSSKVRDKAMQGVYDVDRYHNGQSKYVKGKGWQ